MGHRRGAHGVDGDLHVAVCPVLEPDRHRKPRPELAVDLALDRPRADSAPADRVGDVLRHDRVQKLAADRESVLQDPQQHLPSDAQAEVDVTRAVEMGIVDQALPARRRPWLLEVHAHRDAQILLELARLLRELLGVLERRVGIVDAARPDHHEQPVVLAVEDRVGALATGKQRLRVRV